MPGAGTKTDITTSNAPARCLDLTRLISRQGRGPLTGVDRVELAYLRRLVAEPEPLFLLVRTSLGFLLLDQGAATEVFERIEGNAPWGALDLIGRLPRKSPVERRRAEADLRRMARARCRPSGLRRMLGQHVPQGTTYLNIGHSNLSEAVLGGWHDATGGHVTVLVHDMIPLEYPEFQRPGTPERFEAKMRRVSAHADIVIYNSDATRTDAERWFKDWGRVPKGTVAHLGVDMPQPDASNLPADIDPTRPWFVALGTIEPRKNHALLLDAWDEMAKTRAASDLPQLIIAGARGWNNETVFQRLDSSPLLGNAILEMPGLDDHAIAALMAGSAGLLFPSLAEGYGLPPLEAAALGVPVVCSDLPVYRELLGNIPVYASSSDVYLWVQIITELAEKRQAGHVKSGAKTRSPEIPTWADHFNLVLKVT